MLKVGERYMTARHETGFGPYICIVEVLLIKRSKHPTYYKGDYSVKTRMLHSPNPYGAPAGKESWTHHVTERNMDNAWYTLQDVKDTFNGASKTATGK